MAFAIEDSLRWVASEKADGEIDIEALVADFSRLLYRVAYSVLRDAAEAEDVVQEAFLRSLQDPARLRAVRDKRPWMARIAFNLALDRKRRLRPAQLDDAAMDSLVARDVPVDQALEQSRRVNTVLTLVDALPAREREVMLLAGVEELSVAEIAAMLDRSENSVRSLLFRGRAHLQERIERAQRSARKEGAR